MKNAESEKNTIKKIYGKENLKEILSSLLEKMFMKEIKNVEKTKNN